MADIIPSSRIFLGCLLVTEGLLLKVTKLCLFSAVVIGSPRHMRRLPAQSRRAAERSPSGAPPLDLHPPAHLSPASSSAAYPGASGFTSGLSLPRRPPCVCLSLLKPQLPHNPPLFFFFLSPIKSLGFAGNGLL